MNKIDNSEKTSYDKFYKRFYLRKGDSFILDLFYGIMKIIKFCKKCGNINLIEYWKYKF